MKTPKKPTTTSKSTSPKKQPKSNPKPADKDAPIRLQKIIADLGLASRREAETFIRDGLVTVNGKVASLGDKAIPSQDAIKVSGKLLKSVSPPPSVTIAMNKPRGLLCSNDDPFYEDKDTVFSVLPKEFQNLKLFCAGRLDKNSEGLLILTNDGDIAQKITHPSHQITKKYYVTLSKPFDLKLAPKLIKGITVQGEFLKAQKIIPIKPDTLEVHLNQGRKREIRRLFESLGYFVNRLQRFQIGNFALKNMPIGSIKLLTKKDLSLLFSD